VVDMNGWKRRKEKERPLDMQLCNAQIRAIVRGGKDYLILPPLMHIGFQYNYFLLSLPIPLICPKAFNFAQSCSSSMKAVMSLVEYIREKEDPVHGQSVGVKWRHSQNKGAWDKGNNTLRKFLKHATLSCLHGTKKIIIREQGGVSHFGLAIYIEKYLRAKEELWKFKYFTMQKYNLKKIALKETKIVQDIITLL